MIDNSIERSSPTVHCLVVEDEPNLRRVLARLMENNGYTCDEASNGVEALAILEQKSVTLVLTDVHMPVLDGIALLRQATARFPETAIMLVTAVDDVRTAVRCLGEGAMDYVTKPFHLDEVSARVRQALERRRLVLENRDYHEHLQEKVGVQARRIEQLFLASIQSLADALEVKDTYTHGHSLRVSRYSTLIAREMGLDEDFARQVELGGRVHDLGKIGVRETVLNKPGPLTDEEYRHIMTHPEVGWRILAPLLHEQPRALNVVRHHHERWDGRGLPDGLEGTAIPLEARIVAVADTFDAMTSERPYRPGAALDATLAELRRCAGHQFDPDPVAAFVAVIGRGQAELEQAKVASLAAGSP